MNGVNQLKHEFAEHKKNARHYNPQVLPIINELEFIAINRATGKMTPTTARNKLKSCCLKVGINPIEIDALEMKPTFNFVNKPKMNQKRFNIKPLNLVAQNNKSPLSERARRRFSVPAFPMPAHSLKKPQHPTFSLMPKKQKGKMKRFELKPISLKPLNFGKNPKKKQVNFIKPFKIKGLF